ncbi:MAG TPA: hypothetical protein DGN59_02185 [Candidatus Latescibacteria bacterium]|nr:hypothetical protein [Candidatus Latescibacterota bacterium]
MSAPDRLTSFAALAADTGMRKSEIGRLFWQDCDFETGILTGVEMAIAPLWALATQGRARPRMNWRHRFKSIRRLVGCRTTGNSR